MVNLPSRCICSSALCCRTKSWGVCLFFLAYFSWVNFLVHRFKEMMGIIGVLHGTKDRNGTTVFQGPKDNSHSRRVHVLRPENPSRRSQASESDWRVMVHWEGKSYTCTSRKLSFWPPHGLQVHGVSRVDTNYLVKRINDGSIRVL